LRSRPSGEKAGRRVFSRHRLLTRFFEEVLSMPAEAASEQACAMEHSLTDEAMVRMVRFFEFLGAVHRSSRAFASVRWCKSASPRRTRSLPQWCSVCAKKKEFRP
jgi:Mn-dependent DtxR family transcriptional regulator